MSNLGGYQTIVQLSKKVGGPGKLGLIVFGAGYLVLRPTETLARSLYKKAKNGLQRETTPLDRSDIYTVSAEADSGNGLLLAPGDKFSEVGRDKETVIINVEGHESNPHVVSALLLSQISDYPSGA